MPSPFPGMNPYIEQDALWKSFHVRFLADIFDRLVAQLRPNYIVMIDEHIYVHETPGRRRRRLLGIADVSVAARSRSGGVGAPAVVEVVEAPSQVRLRTQETRRVPFLEVRDRRNRELIAVVELLSPSNKDSGADRNQYVAKRDQLLSSEAHFVEIDLLRGGRPMSVEDRPKCAYSVLVSRAEDRPRAGFWPIGLSDRLPIIPIPLSRPGENARIDLQEVLDRVYDAAGYEDFLYEGKPQPALSVKDAAWARRFVPAAS